MKEGPKILLAYDGSEHSKKDLSEAIDIAKRFSGSITVVPVYWEPQVTKVEGIEVRDQPSLRLLEEAEESLKASGVKYELRSERSNHPLYVILNIAKAEGFDCIALGTRGLGGAKAWLLGSVSSKVAAETECTVIITKWKPVYTLRKGVTLQYHNDAAAQTQLSKLYVTQAHSRM